MAKDPRFNFYVDNWIGGTEGFTLEQEGAYLSLILMQTKVGRFTKDQAIDKLMQKTRGNTAVCTGLINFLLPKFETDGEYFWSPRLEKEIEKSKSHSIKQSERVKSRWDKNKKDTAVDTVVIPVNRIGNRSRNNTKDMGVQGEKNEVLIPVVKTELEIAFDKYLEMRKKIKKPATDHAIEIGKKKVMKLSGGNEQLAIEIINQSTFKSWTDFYPVKDSGANTGEETKGNKLDRIMEQI